MQVKLVADGDTEVGGTPMIMHNERLADPLDSFTMALGEVTGVRKKTHEDHREIARREFFGGLYMNPPIEWPLNGSSAKALPALPAWNVLRCLQEGAKRNRRGPDVLRGCAPLTEFAVLSYDGPTGPEALWKDGRFALRKSVGVQRSRTMRTRPIFRDWRIELMIEVDKQIWDLHQLRLMWRDAGLYAGLGDMRPVYGRFVGVIEELTPTGRVKRSKKAAAAA